MQRVRSSALRALLVTGALSGSAAALPGSVGCSATPPSNPPDAVVVPTSKPTAEACPPGSTADRCAKAVATASADAAPACFEGARCAGALAPDEMGKLDVAVAAAAKGVIDSQFGDVHAMVELSRLELRRDGDTADIDGPNDAARALRNAIRAVAVDDAGAPPRVALALARARSLTGGKLLADPITRTAALEQVNAALRAVPQAGGATSAAAKTLEGYVALENGNPAAAKTAFEAATALDPALGAAWMGLGDVARATFDFDAATAAYKTASTRLPDDATVRRAFEMASRKQALSLPAAALATFPLTPGPLAPAVRPAVKCAASVKEKDPLGPMCKGLAELQKASTREDKLRAAKSIVDAWRGVQPLCQNHDKACDGTVAKGLVAASNGFKDAGMTAKSIAAGLLFVQSTYLPGHAAEEPAVLLSLGDRYMETGMLDLAADYYSMYLKVTSTTKGPVLRRALGLRLALGRDGDAMKLAGTFAKDSEAPPADRAAALMVTAALGRANGNADALSWLGNYASVLEQGGRKDAARELGKPPPPAPANECASPLACAIRRIAADPRWAP